MPPNHIRAIGGFIVAAGVITLVAAAPVGQALAVTDQSNFENQPSAMSAPQIDSTADIQAPLPALPNGSTSTPVSDSAILGIDPALRSGSTSQTSATLVVEKGNSDNYDTIQNAIDDATDGDTVEVRPGTYPEFVTIDKSITLTAPDGATLDGSTIEARGFENGVTITDGAGAVVSGFTIEHYETRGIFDEAGGDWTVRDVVVRESSTCVDAKTFGGDWTIRDTRITDCDASGVDADGSSGDWTIRDTTITNVGVNGVNAFGSSGDWTIRSVSINTTGEHGIDASDTGGNWTIRQTTLRDTAWHGVRAVDASGFGTPTGEWTIRSTTITGSGWSGVAVMASPLDWTIHNTTITDSGEPGVDAELSEGDWTIAETEIVNSSAQGVNTGSTTTPDSGSTGNWTIQGTTIADSGGSGVNAKDSTGNWRIRNTEISDSGASGVDTTRSTNAWVIQNTTIEESSSAGIIARQTSGSWEVHQSALHNNTQTDDVAASGIDATGADIEGDATQNWWGAESGPDDDDCAGNVNCSNWLISPSSGKTVSEVESPEAAFTVDPEAPTAGEEVTFDASKSMDGVNAYEWTVQKTDSFPESGRIVTHSFADAGEYEVTLTVTGTTGQTASTTVTVTVKQPDDEGTETSTETDQKPETATETDQETETVRDTDPDETETSDDAAEEAETANIGAPGFGVPAPLAALAGASYLLKRRLTERDEK